MRRIRSVRIVCAAAGVLVASAPARAQSRTTPLVVGIADAKTGAPLRGAELVLPDLGLVVHADALGEARVPEVPNGRHRVRVRMFGYAASDVELDFAGDTVGSVFMLEPATSTLDTVRITAPATSARLQAFETRRRLGQGHFLTADGPSSEVLPPHSGWPEAAPRRRAAMDRLRARRRARDAGCHGTSISTFICRTSHAGANICGSGGAMPPRTSTTSCVSISRSA